MFGTSRSISESTKTDILHDLSYDQLSFIDLTMLMLRKPVELKKVLDSIPKPARAVPKNGLPAWYKLGLESKLPVPKIPQGKIVFSRGKMGENVRNLSLGAEKPSFDITDPYGYQIKYDYVPLHDPHLRYYFQQKLARDRMKKLGFATADGSAVCSLKEFNDFRKFLYIRFQDRVNMVTKKMDQELQDTILMRRVEAEVTRQKRTFEKKEKARLYLEKVGQALADEIAEKKRQIKEQEKRNAARMAYVEEFKEKQRKERIAKGLERANRIRQRVLAANEMELRRKIIMMRNWRRKENARCARLKREKEEKARREEQEVNNKWAKRVETQNYKIMKDATLLKIYTHNMNALISRRARKAQIKAYNYDLQLQKLRMANLRAAHGGTAAYYALVKKMGVEFEKCKRGMKGMSPEYAQELAVNAMKNSWSTKGDPLMMLSQARAKMDILTVMPTAPIYILDELLQTAVMVFARRRCHLLLRNVECKVHADVYISKVRPVPFGKFKTTRWMPLDQVHPVRLIPEERMPTENIGFGNVEEHDPEHEPEVPMRTIKGRRPTPVPSLMVLAQAAFADQIKDLPEPVERSVGLEERNKLIYQVHLAKKILMQTVTDKVLEGLDTIIYEVTLPPLRKRMEWGEAVEAMSDALVNNRISKSCPEIQRTTVFLAYRILRVLNLEMKEDKYRTKHMAVPPKRVNKLDTIAKQIISEPWIPRRRRVKKRKPAKSIVEEPPKPKKQIEKTLQIRK